MNTKKRKSVFTTKIEPPNQVYHWIPFCSLEEIESLMEKHFEESKKFGKEGEDIFEVEWFFNKTLQNGKYLKIKFVLSEEEGE